MPIRSLVWILTYILGAIFAFVNPVYGLFTYFLDYYAHPPLRWWGKSLPDFRWSFVISIITLIALFIKYNNLPKLKIKEHLQTKWFVFFILNAFFVSLFASVSPDVSWEYTLSLSKLIVLYFLITNTVRTKEDFRFLMIIQILGVFLWGWNAFESPNRSAGRLIALGGVDSYNDNAAAAQLVTILPFIGVVFLVGKRWEKAICFMAAPFVLNAFILCNSRGAFMGLLVTGAAALLISKGTLRWKVLLSLLIGALLFYNLMDPRFVERQQTIQNYEEDAAANDRIDSWKGALQLVKDHPLGTGGGGFSTLSPIYIPHIVEAHEGELRNVHSTYLQAASEWGLLGVFFFMAALISTFIELHRLRRHPPLTLDEKRIHVESLAIELGLIGLMTAGIFTSRLYAEAIYWLPAMTGALKNIQANERDKAADYQRALERDEAADHQLTLSV